MQVDHSAIQRVAVMARDAIEVPERWNDVVRVICQYVGASGGALITRSTDPDWRALSAAWGNAADGLQTYLGEWAVHDPWEAAIPTKRIFRAAGEVRTGDEFLPRSALEHTAFYCDFARRFDLEELIALKIFDADDQTAPPSARISIFRPPGPGEFDDQHRRFLSLLHPYLDRALRAQWAIGPSSAAALAAGNLLDHLPNPIWVLGRRAEVVVANAAAQRMQGGIDAQIRTHLGALVSIGHLTQSDILALLACPTGAAAAVVLGTGETARRVTARIVPLRYDSACRAAWPRGHALLTLDAGAAPEAPSLHDLAIKTWGLTEAEAHVAVRVAEGFAPTEIAQEFSVSCSTVRSQLQAIFVKTDTRRQGALIALLLRAAAASHPGGGHPVTRR